MRSSDAIVFVNGQLTPQGQASLPLHDAGFVQGATVTDLCRTFRHRLFRLDDHLARFRRSCTAARIPQPRSDDELAHIADEVVTHNAALLPSDHDLALVMIATPGPVGYYLGQPGGAGSGTPTLIMHTFPLPFARYVRLFEQGAALITPSVRHVPAVCVDPRIKQRSRMHWWLAEQEVHETDPTASALLLDLDGHATETAAANFLIVKDGVVRTPPRKGVLEGVSLQVTEELCSRLGIPFEEAALTVEDCLEADEAMLASTPYCLAGVSSINGTSIPWPGSFFERLLTAWNGLAGLDIRRQIFANRYT